MKLKKILPIIVLAALLIFALLPGEQSTDVGIIGGADGPTAIFVTSPTDSPSGDTAAEPAEAPVGDAVEPQPASAAVPMAAIAHARKSRRVSDASCFMRCSSL